MSKTLLYSIDNFNVYYENNDESVTFYVTTYDILHTKIVQNFKIILDDTKYVLVNTMYDSLKFEIAGPDILHVLSIASLYNKTIKKFRNYDIMIEKDPYRYFKFISARTRKHVENPFGVFKLIIYCNEDIIFANIVSEDIKLYINLNRNELYDLETFKILFPKYFYRMVKIANPDL
jgi:hypothetical protein